MYAAAIDYATVNGVEVTFTSEQTVDDVQCISIVILDGSILEDVEQFRVVLSAMDPFVIIPQGQESIVVNINEDPEDGRSIFRHDFDLIF